MSKVAKDFAIQGSIAAPGTALKANGDINPEVIPSYVDYFVKSSVNGVFVLGTLGEGLSLTVDERKQVAKAWVDAAKGKLSSVIVHVGAGNIRDTMELAANAESIGATAIACMLPSFFKPTSEEIAVDYLRQVAEKCPNTPFYYYCINFMSGIYMNTANILEKSAKVIPNLRGAKISSRELPGLLDASLAVGGGLQVMVGTDEQYLPMLSIGLRVPVLNSYLGPLYARIRDAFDKGDMATARAENAVARKLVLLRGKYMGGPALVKATMRCLGVDLGPVRSPLEDLPKALEAELKAELQQFGLPTA